MDYRTKYIKYKMKYLDYKQEGGRRKSKKMNKKHLLSRNIDGKMDSIKPNYIENVSEPWFSLILLGLKTVEGRKNKGRFKDMKVGDIVEWKNNDFKPRSVLTEIIGKAEYPTFREYLEIYCTPLGVKKGLEKCLPSIQSIDNGIDVYFKYYTKEEEKEFGVVAIRLKVI